MPTVIIVMPTVIVVKLTLALVFVIIVRFAAFGLRVRGGRQGARARAGTAKAKLAKGSPSSEDQEHDCYCRRRRDNPGLCACHSLSS
jgi:hypothetical protein